MPFGTVPQPGQARRCGFYWGAVQQCTEKLPQQISVKVNLCVQDPGGPSHFHCDVYKGGKKGDQRNPNPEGSALGGFSGWHL